jgi:hypothetical protein
MGILEYQATSPFRYVAHDGVLWTFSNRSVTDRDNWCGPSGQAAWTLHHVEYHTLGHSPPASQAVRRVGPALYSLRANWSMVIGHPRAHPNPEKAIQDYVIFGAKKPLD